LLFVVLGSSLAVFGGWGIAVFVGVMAVAIYIRQAESLPSAAQLLLLLAVLLVLAAFLLPGVNSARESGRRMTCANNLHQVAMALQAYHQAQGCFPPLYTADKSGKPAHSWRVLLLPYQDQSDLYNLYAFTEPWDGPKNKQWSAIPLPVYACPCEGSTHAQQTSYVAVAGANTAWSTDKPRKLADFGKDASTTIMLIEVSNSGIAWAEPKDLLLDSITAAEGKSTTLALTSSHGRREGFFVTYDYGSCVNVAMADGSVRLLRLSNRSAEELRRLLQIGGCKEEEMGEPERRVNWPNIAALAVWLLSGGMLLIGAVRSRKPVVGRSSEA
jgi:prepilin-type processing-associated H-X9-DG protein